MKMLPNALVILLVIASIRSSSGQECSICRPSFTEMDPTLNNPCSGTGSNPSLFCSDSITKTAHYNVYWPDSGTNYESADLTANGRSDCGRTCNPGNVIGAPYSYIECWPQFYTPTKTSNSFVATADSQTTVNYFDWCRSTVPIVSYVYAVGCSVTNGPLSLPKTR
jgi:hypothetical protein